MADARVTAQALDVILKLEAEQLATALPSYFAVPMPPIVRPFPTELPQLELHAERLDTVFELADGSLLHLEYQSEHRADTLLRFLSYDVALYRAYRRPIHTVVIYGPDVATAQSELDAISVRYAVASIFLGRRDGEETYRRLRKRVRRHEPLGQQDRLDLVFLPLMAHRRSLEEVVAGGLDLARALPEEEREGTSGALLALAYHYGGHDTFERLLERLMATNYEILDRFLTRYVEQRAEQLAEQRAEQLAEQRAEQLAEQRAEQLAEQRAEQLVEQVLQQGRLQTKRDDVLKVLTSRFGAVPDALRERIVAISDLPRLDTLFDLALSTQALDDVAQALEPLQPEA